MLHAVKAMTVSTTNAPTLVVARLDLAVRISRKRRKGVAVPREPLFLPEERNAVWSMDFVFDALSNGRRLESADHCR